MAIRHSFAAAAVALATLATGLPQAAAAWPNGPIRFVLHVSPGGATDVMGRRLAEGLRQETGVDVVVENQSGGSGARQVALLTRAAKDGSVIGSSTASHLGMLLQNDAFDLSTVEWSCGLVLDPFLLAVKADSPIRSLADLTAKAKAAPGSLSIAGFGEASGGHIAWLMVAEAAGLGDAVNWVPYDSVGDGVVAALGGHNDIVIAYPGLVRQHVAAGKLRVIGVMTDQRIAMLPDAPTMAEQGVAVDTSWQQFRGVITPAGTPMAVQQALCAAVEKVMARPDMQAYVAESDLVPGYMAPAQFRSFVEAQNKTMVTWTEKLAAQK